MKLIITCFIIILSTLSVYSQGFADEVLKRKLILSEFKDDSLKFEIALRDSKNTSVIIKVIKDDMKENLPRIENNSTILLSTAKIKYIIVRHKKRLLLRFNQKIKDEIIAPKTNRIRVTSESAGGSTTSTTVSST